MEYLNSLAINTIGPIVAFLESLSWMGTNTYFVTHPAVEDFVGQLAGQVGMEATLIKYTLGLFLVYPLAAIQYRLPGKNVKHAFSMIVGFILVQFIFGPDWIHSFISSLGTYLICLLLPKKIQHKVAFFFVMGYMTGSHIYRMYVSYMSGVFDFTGTQMVLTMKLTSFAYNVYDGIGDRKNVFPEQPHTDKNKAKVYANRRKFAIEKLPNLLEYFGYVYCFSCILAGPAFEYMDYKRSIEDTAYLTESKDKNGKIVTTVQKPHTVMPALLRLIIGVVCLVAHMKISAVFRIPDQYNPVFIASHPYHVRWGYLMVAMFAERLKFYFVWKLAEGACIMGGFGFEGFSADGSPKGFRGVENIDIKGFETATSVQIISKNWNKRTQGWLERYTYHRTGRSLVATYFISALWHGLYPGFFIMFMSLPLLTNVERLIKAKINPRVVPEFDGYNLETYPKNTAGWVYWILCWVCTMALVNYVVQVFSMGSLENSLTALGGHYYVPHILSVVAYVVLEMLPPVKKSATTTKKKD